MYNVHCTFCLRQAYIAFLMVYNVHIDIAFMYVICICKYMYIQCAIQFVTYSPPRLSAKLHEIIHCSTFFLCRSGRAKVTHVHFASGTTNTPFCNKLNRGGFIYISASGF